METIELKVDGMTCGSCAASVTRALRRLPGVRDATVDLQGGVARVIAENASQRVQAFVAALDEAGYKARSSSAATTGQQHKGDHAHGASASGRGGCCSH